MGSQFLSEDQLRKLPYLRNIPKDGRTVPLQTFFEQTDRDWHLYLPVKRGELGRLAGGEPISGSYLASEPAAPGVDFELKLGTLIVQHMSFLDLLEQFGKLENDVHRCGAVLEKYDVVWAVRASKDRSASLLIQSELEYLLFLLRAMYDVLQVIVQIVGRKLILIGSNGRPALKNLPKSFADVIIKDHHFRTLDEIQSRWKVPRPLAEWYVAEGAFFQLLRDLRDGIAHRGASPPTVFETEWGFAIAPDALPWSRVDALLRGERWNGRLASLRALFAEFVSQGIRSTERFAEAVEAFVQLPDQILGDVRLFVRSPFGARIVAIERIRENPWEGRQPTG